MIKWFNILKKDTDTLINRPIIKYQKPDGTRLVTTSIDYIQQFSFMYRITGDKKYADRAWRELQNICVNYPDWNDKGQFIDTAVMASGAAIGYDWLYDYLSDYQKKIVENAINKNALSIVLTYYKNNSHFFIYDKNNWNIACNSGMILASLAIYDKGNSSNEIIQYGLKSIQKSLTTYYSDGSVIEGARYWAASTEYLINLTSSLNNSLNYKNYFNNILDIGKIADYSMYIAGKQGIFNYSDTDENWIDGYYNLWFAKQLNKPNLTQYYKLYKTKNSNVNVYDLLWYDPTLYNSSDNNNKLDKYFESTQVVTMRSDYQNNLGTFIGFKGGLAGAPHGDLDIGSFVYDSLGIRWAVDLGAENYGVNGYFDDGVYGDRWNYYRTRAEGHNTLVIGSSSHEDQVLGSESKIIKSNLNSNEPYAILDMTPSYSNKALNVEREVRLLNNRKDVLITDNFTLEQEDEVTWQMHTQANASIVDSGKGVILTKDNKKVYLKLLSTGNMVFQVVDAVPSSTSPNPSGQTKNTGIKKIIVKTKGKTGNIKVQITPLENESSYINNGSFEDDLNNWGTWIGAGSYKVSTDAAAKKDGVKSLKIYNTTSTASKGSVSQVIDGTNLIGKAIKLTQWLKTDSLTGAIRIRTSYKDGSGNTIGSMDVKTIDISGTTNWNQQTYTINVPNNSNIKSITIEYLYDNCTGTLWLDGVTGIKAEQVVTNNLLQNGDFEEGQSHWSTWAGTKSYNVSTDAAAKKDGVKSLKIYNTTASASKGGVNQIIDGTNLIGKAIKLTQWLKTDSLTGAIRIRTSYKDGSGNTIGNMDVKTIDISGTTNWNQQTYTINVPNNSNIKSITIEYLYDNCTGTLWLDGVTGIKAEQVVTNNLLQNGDFEEGQSHWSTWAGTKSYNVSTDAAAKKDGVKSLKIYNTTASASKGGVNQTIDGTNLIGKAIKLTQWLKTDSLTGAIRIRTSYKDGSGNTIGNMDVKTIDISGTTNWNQQTYIINVPNNSNIKSIMIEYLYDNCTGTLWLDGVTGIKVEQVVTNNLLQNGDFEEGQSHWTNWESSGNFSVDTDASVKKNGSKSLKLHNGTTLSRGGVGETIDAANLLGKALKVTQWLKSDSLTGPIRLRATYKDVNGNTIGSTDVKTLDISGTTDWNQQICTFNVPNNSNIKNITIEYVYDNCTGALWVDGIDGESTAQVVTTNVISNGDFEESQSYWTNWKSSGDFSVETDASVKKNGSKSLKLHNGTTLSRGSFSETIDATQLLGKALNITQWLKSNSLTGPIRLRATYTDANGNAVGSMDVKTVGISGTTDWNQQTYTFNVPNNSNIKNVTIEYVYDNCTGTLWVDGIDGESTAQVVTTNVISNGDFEESQSYWNTWKSSGDFSVENRRFSKEKWIKITKIA